ncbi:MAG: DUF6973 domain-containing protein, partial [Deltaproteobacteria bacterium]
MLLKLFILMNLTLLSSAQDICLSWFTKAKLKSDPQCLIKCSALITDLSTFRCPERCTEFCAKDSLVDRLLGKAAYYPGLTAEERKLISQYPKEALKVFLAKQKAETLTAKRFKRDAEGDESDAFRHFVWAGLLAKELGSDRAKVFLDAHEAGQSEDSAERAMDLANNRAGL